VRGLGGGLPEFPEDVAPEATPEEQQQQPEPGIQDVLAQILPLLQQEAVDGADETEVFEDLADWFEDEGVDEALPILAGVAARAAVRPLVRRTGAAVGGAMGRQLVRSTTQAARTLVARRGPRAIRALPRIARGVGRVAARGGLRPAALPAAIRRTAARVAARPTLTRQLARPTRPPSARGGGLVRSLTLRGPVEVTVDR